MNYKYYMPTKVFVGKGCINQNKEVLKTLGNKALIVTGKHSAKANGSEKDVKKALDDCGIAYLVYDQVMSNPTISCCYEGAAIAKANGVDFIIAIGGGSPMDAGKAIALLSAQSIAQGELFSGNYDSKVLPMAFVPTTAGTGAEVTQYSILTNDGVQSKTSIATELIFPTVSFLDAQYMKDLSITTTINTAIDALSHAVEGMLSIRASLISNTLAIQSIGMIMDQVPNLLLGLTTNESACLDEASREQLLQASYMAGMVIAQTGTTAVHAMGYSLTYFKDIDHGRANGLLLAAYLKLVEKEQPELIEQILKAMKLKEVDAFKAILDTLFGQKEALSSEEISRFSKIAITTKNIGNGKVKPMEEDIERMYVASF